MRIGLMACAAGLLVVAAGADRPPPADTLPALPAANHTHFAALASASDAGGGGVRLRVVLAVTGPSKKPERWMQATGVVDGKKWRVLDMDGKPVASAAVRKSLDRLRPILLTLDEMPEPFYLATTRPDTLIVIVPRDALDHLDDVPR